MTDEQSQRIQSGAEYILVPSYTTSVSGFHRVYYSCRARALENQCFVIMSSVVGECSNAGETEILTGQANILGPIDESFSQDGLIAQGPLNEERLIVASLRSEQLSMLRKNGQVQNYYDAAYCATLLEHPIISLCL